MKATSGPKPEPVANLYAKALFELAREQGQVDAVYGDLVTLAGQLGESPELRQALVGHALTIESREKIFQELAQKCQVNAMVARLGGLLISRSRMSLLDAVANAFRDLVDESKNTIRGKVTTVAPLSDAESADLTQAFSKKLNKTVVLDPVINKDILGGLIVEVQGLTFDGSLKTTIRRLKENLERQSI